MGDNTFVVNMKVVGDISDARSNIDALQKSFSKLKLPDKIGDNLGKKISEFYKEYEKYQKKISEGVKTQGDYNQVEKSLNRMRGLYQEIGKEADKVTKLDLAELIDTDTGDFKKVVDDIRKTIESINKVKVDPKGLTSAFDQIKSVTKNTKIVGKDGILGQLIGHLNTGEVDKAKQKLQELQAYAQKVAPRLTESGARAPGTLSTESYQSLISALQVVSTAFDQAEAEADPFIQKLKELQTQLEKDKAAASQDILGDASKFKAQAKNVDSVTESLKRMHAEEFNFNREAQNIDRQIQSYFGLSQMIRKVGDIARDAFATVKELDKAMTQTAVVTNFSVGDMWDMLPTYTAQANQLGSTIKDVYEAATLYYQQGLNTNQAMGLANETLKMARIAGLGAAEATDMMTAALRGFNMEINQQSAQKINDIYSELAAITASDTAEIGSAMERTASIANSANMEFATTSAFLAQMIETTREAPENLGTAMKTIVARFQEMKQDPTKLIDSEGVAMDANKVDKALKTIGVNLMNTKGEFRDLDDVFLDISQRWDSLTQGQQRYIATIAAGSRQQSRFIAMMSNYERTMELVDAANNSAGASQRQFEKTLDSMEAKLNKLKNAWDQFTMGLMNNQIIKLGVDALTGFLTVTNKIINALSALTGPFQGVTKSVLTLVSTLGMLNFGKKAARGLVMGGAAWFKGEKGGFLGNFTQGFKGGSAEAQSGGREAGITWTQAATKAINSSSGTIKGAMRDAFNMQAAGSADLIRASFTEILNRIQVDSNNFGSGFEAEGREAGEAFKQGLIFEVESGQQSLRNALQEAIDVSGLELNADDLFAELEHASRAQLDPDKLSTGFEDLTKTASSAGNSIREFGYALQGTPLEGFGNTLIRIGNLMDSASRMAKTFGKNFSKAIEAAGNVSGAGGKTSTFFKEMFPNLTKIIGLLWKMPLPLKIIMAVALAAGAIALKVAHDNKKALESASDAAAKASEAYDSAKQETSELADAIEQVKSNEDAFEGLVAGTAAFNEQLVTANEQIMELIKKYPMLIEEGKDYVTTDKNGLMHINQQGLDAVRDYQRQKQANASALSIIQTADLNTVETKQKVAQMRKVKGEETLEQYGQRQKEADLLEQQAQAQADMAKFSAVNMSLVDKEIHNREKVSAILADQYEARKDAVDLEGQSIHELKQQYADFYGYKYDKSTKKITDIEGNEIEVDKNTVKDAVKEMTVITSFEADGKSLDSMLNHVDNTFSNTLGDAFEDSGHLFSDILSNNIDVDDDLIKKVLENPEKIQDAVDSLSEKEIAAVLGVTTDAVAAAPDQYKDELVNKLTERATNIAETQAQTYTDLATMMAQTVGTSVVDSNGEVIAKISEEQKATINEQLSKLTSEQKNMLSSIGTALQEGAGTDSMRTFIKQATDIYTSGAEDAITDLDDIIQGVNWDSPTARLKAYNDMIADGVDSSVQQLGQDLLNSTDSANLLGEAFEEFYDSNEFQEMAENMDKFADASGKLSASSVEEMAKQCGSLNNLLDTGAISAGGVAAALNAMGSSGNITILDLNQHLLEFLSTANQLEDVLSDAHNIIENFDWGIDTGESKDFAIDSTKKWKELYEGGEFGNQQLENYAKFVLGQERWNQELEDAGGNIEQALANMDKDISVYSEGFMDSWREMADSTNGRYADFHRGENNDIIWETNGRTTEQLVKDLATARGITEEWAKLMVEDFANYSYDFKTELASNDFTAALEKGDYITSRTGGNDAVNVTRSEINALAAAQNKTPEEIEELIRTTVDENGKQLDVLENVDANGQALLDETSITDLNKQYSEKETVGTDKEGQSWLSLYQKKDAEGVEIENTTDLKTAISGAVSDGLQSDQATEMARQEGLKALQEGVEVFYDGVKLQQEDLADSQAFDDRIAKITDNARWNAVGEAIAQGYISYIKGNEDSSPTNSSNDWGSAKDGTEKGPSEPINWDTGTDQEVALREEMRAKARENWSQLWQSIKEGFSGGTPIEDPKAEAIQQSRENWKSIWEGVKTAFSSGEEVEDPKIVAAEKAKENWKSIWEKVKEAFSTTPKIEPNTGGAANSGQKSSSGGNSQTANQNLSVTYTGEVANPDELKASLESQITSILNQVTAQTQKMQTSVSVTVNYKKGEQAKAKKQTTTVDYKKGKQEKAEDKEAKVNYTLGTQAAPTTKTATVNYTLGSVPTVPTQYATLKLNLSESSKKFNVVPAFKGLNNKIVSSTLPSFGSLAKGTKSRYGQVGPRNNGGLTLTGEKGFEIAWIPSENRSMIVGANGPQMLNLPKDAVVWTHEQSKKILKQKSIPAGSHAGLHDSEPTTASTKQSTTPKTPKTPKTPHSTTTDKEIAKIIHKAGKITVWWENQTRKVDGAQRKVDKALKQFETEIQKIGATRQSINTVTTQYKKQLNNSIDLNKKSLAVANKQLRKLDTKNSKKTISYEVTKTTTKNGKTTKAKETKQGKINLKNFISYDAVNDTYVINQKALNRVAKKNKSKAEAIKDLADKEINDKLSKRNTARDNLVKAQEALDKVNDEVYKSFYKWENSLNKVYLLSQKLEDLSNRLNVTRSNEDLIEARNNAGFGRIDDGQRLLNVLKEERNLMIQQLGANSANLEANAQAYADSLQLSTYAARYAKAPNSSEAKQDFTAAKLALKFLKDTGLNTKDTFDYDTAISKLEGKGYNEETINRIKEVLDKINENRNNLVNAQNETLTSATAIYNKLSEYQDFIAEFETDLLSGLEDQTEKEINKLDKLNSSLSKAYKDLLDQVKQALDERRQKEDNAKTEQDISRKQQRLSMLRADTSGGHQTEIAQLEREIGEAQQNYQRSLEDQLINKLQQQGDEAEKQRQRQIELLQAQNELAKITGTNLEEVKEWLKNPKANEEQIKNAWLSGKGYNEATPTEQKNLLEEWNLTWAKYGAYSNEAKNLETAIKSNKTLTNVESTVTNIDKTLSQKVGYDAKSFKNSGGTVKEAKLAGFSAKQLKEGGYSDKSIVNAGYKKKDLAEAGITAKNLKTSGVSVSTAKNAGFNAKELKENGYTLKELIKGGYNYKQLTGAGFKATDIRKIVNANTAKSIGMPDKTIAKQYGATKALKAGVSGSTVQKTLDTSTAKIQKIINQNKKDKATQKDLAGTKATIDTNGKTKGGNIKGTVSASGKTAAANKGSALYTQKIDTKTGKTTGKATITSIDKLTPTLFAANKKEATDALISAIKNTKVGSVINKNMKSFVGTAGIAGKTYKLQNGIVASVGGDGKIYYNYGKAGVQIWDAAAGKLTLEKYNKKNFIAKAKKNNTVSREYKQVLKKNGITKFATGGLATQTGPAWLDGTPSKPELVLNSTDTKNFLTLKDILSKAMNSIGSTDNTTYGDVMYEININVDKIEKDYDVDKVVDKVKREIVKGAGYRNVTQVRNLR